MSVVELCGPTSNLAVGLRQCRCSQVAAGYNPAQGLVVFPLAKIMFTTDKVKWFLKKRLRSEAVSRIFLAQRLTRDSGACNKSHSFGVWRAG